MTMRRLFYPGESVPDDLLIHDRDSALRNRTAIIVFGVPTVVEEDGRIWPLKPPEKGQYVIGVSGSGGIRMSSALIFDCRNLGEGKMLYVVGTAHLIINYSTWIYPDNLPLPVRPPGTTGIRIDEDGARWVFQTL